MVGKHDGAARSAHDYDVYRNSNLRFRRTNDTVGRDARIDAKIRFKSAGRYIRAMIRLCILRSRLVFSHV